MDKLSKILNYLEAAVYFIESGIAMEREPHISMSSYTMFAETVELIKWERPTCLWPHCDLLLCVLLKKQVLSVVTGLC